MLENLVPACGWHEDLDDRPERFGRDETKARLREMNFATIHFPFARCMFLAARLVWRLQDGYTDAPCAGANCPLRQPVVSMSSKMPDRKQPEKYTRPA